MSHEQPMYFWRESERTIANFRAHLVATAERRIRANASCEEAFFQAMERGLDGYNLMARFNADALALLVPQFNSTQDNHPILCEAFDIWAGGEDYPFFLALEPDWTMDGYRRERELIASWLSRYGGIDEFLEFYCEELSRALAENIERVAGG